MSMLSAQCDELRAMAESVGLAMPQAATLMMEAADTIWELRNKCSNLVDERETAERNRTRNAREYARLCHENDKLRELVRDMFRDFANADYELKRHNGKTFMAVTRYEPRLQELGVEVDDAS